MNLSRRLLVLASLAPAVLLACGGEATPPVPPPPPPAACVASSEPVPATRAGAAPAPAEAPKPAAPAPVAKYTGLSTPESVLYDADGDRYLVSNINGKPGDKDNNGFISALSPDGQVTTLKLDRAGKNKGQARRAPKGMGIVKGVLYVADITVVRTFDAKSGAPKGDIAIAGGRRF